MARQLINIWGNWVNLNITIKHYAILKSQYQQENKKYDFTTMHNAIKMHAWRIDEAQFDYFLISQSDIYAAVVIKLKNNSFWP